LESFCPVLLSEAATNVESARIEKVINIRFKIIITSRTHLEVKFSIIVIENMTDF
jgi:hypothetical protein